MVGGADLIIADAAAGDISIILTGAPLSEYTIKRKDASSNIVDFGAAVIDGGTTFRLLAQHESATVRKDGAEWWLV